MRILSHEDISLFTAMSGDVNLAQIDETYAKSDMFHGILGHGPWSGALNSVMRERAAGPELRPKFAIGDEREKSRAPIRRLKNSRAENSSM